MITAIRAWLQTYVVYIAVAALVAVSIGAGVLKVQLETERTAHAKTDKAFSDARSSWERESRESAETQREIETLRRQARDRNADATRIELAKSKDAAAGLRAASDELRDEVAALAARADQGRRDSAAGAGVAPVAGPGLVLADLYRGADDEATELAQAFDGARTRGLSCERSYEGLTVKPGG